MSDNEDVRKKERLNYHVWNVNQITYFI